MSKIKRFVASSAASALLASVLAVPSFAAIPSDVVGTRFEEAAKVLGAFDIMVGDGNAFRANDPITRSEVTKIAVALKGLSKVAGSQTTSKFPDVSDDHWAKGFINVGTTEGLVIGDGAGNFRPDDIITYPEVVTILVRAVGYEPKAQSSGGYPGGYISAGNSMGLTSGVSAPARSSGTVSRGEVALMAYNALDVNIMEQKDFGSNPSFVITDETLITTAHDAKKIEGFVTAVGQSSLDGTTCEKGEIIIDGKTYKAEGVDLRNVLGLYVDAYVTDTSKNRPTVKVVVNTTGKNSLTTIAADDIISVTSSSSGKTISYYVGTKKYTKTVPANATVVYNGKSGSIDDLAIIESGSVMIADHNKSKTVVFVNETVNYVVDEVVMTSDRIIDKYGKSPLTLDKDDDKVTFVLEKANKIIGIDELSEWDVITLTMSKDKSVIHGIVTRAEKAGKITEVEDGKVYIDGTAYEVAKNYTEEIKLGDEGTFYLDYENKIAAFDKSRSSQKNYAYLTNIGVKSGFDATLELELLTSDGKLSVYKAADKIKVNSKTYSDAEDAKKAIGGKDQLLTIVLNSDGKVSEVVKSFEGEIDENEFMLNFVKEDAVFTEKTSGLSADDMTVRLDKNTVVFEIPEDAKDTDEYTVTDVSYFADGGKYDVIVYDVTEDLTAGVVIVTASQSKVNEEEGAIIVDKLSSSKDESGEIIVKLYGYQNGERITLTGKSDIFKKGTSSLEKGDIIQAKADSKGSVKALTLLLDSDKAENEFTSVISEHHTTEYGKVTKKFSGSFNLSVNDKANKNYVIGEANIYVIDTESKTNTIKVGDSSDIQKFDDAKPERVFVRTYKDEVKDIIVIR